MPRWAEKTMSDRPLVAVRQQCTLLFDVSVHTAPQRLLENHGEDFLGPISVEWNRPNHVLPENGLVRGDCVIGEV